MMGFSACEFTSRFLLMWDRPCPRFIRINEAHSIIFRGHTSHVDLKGTFTVLDNSTAGACVGKSNQNWSLCLSVPIHTFFQMFPLHKLVQCLWRIWFYFMNGIRKKITGSQVWRIGRLRGNINLICGELRRLSG